MIRTILFDMGNVLLKFDPHLFVQRLHCTDEEEHILINELFRSPEWVMADRGIIDDDELVSRIQKRLPASLHETAEQLIRHWDEPRIPMPGAYELLKDLKEAGYEMYLLTNASLRHHVYWPKCDAAEFFPEDHIFLSADWKLLKPSVEYFETAVKHFGLNREECLFIDDAPANAEAAIFCGIDAIVFNGSHEELREKLRTRGIQI